MTSSILPKTALGPKEGRLPPGLFSPISSDRRRRFPSRRKHIFVFGAVLVVFLIYSTCFQPNMLARFEALQEVPRKVPFQSNLKDRVSPEGADQQQGWRTRFGSRQGSDSQKPILDGTTKDGEKSAAEGAGKQSTPYRRPKEQTGRDGQGSNRRPARPDLEADLGALFALLPDETNMREFLRPIEDGGPERMKELGLRTRAYQKYLNAWEKLHLVDDETSGEVYVRDDLIQSLRDMADNESSGLSSSLTSTIHNYDAFRTFLVKFAEILFPFTSPYFADHMTLHAQFKNAGRGIVLTAGDEQAKYLLTTIYALREIGCDLPIEIMYLGEQDLGEDHRFELESLPGVTTRDLSQMVDDNGWRLAGWAIKPFAMMMSSFREVIFIDADSFFFRNPVKLFDDPDYKKTGALFFRDRTILPESKRKWLLQILPRPIHRLAKESGWWTGASGHHQESGVVVVDKWKHFVAMLLICRFNGSDRDQRDGRMGVYEMMHGDKETFWIGFLLAGDNSFAFHKGAVGSIGVIESSKPTTEAGDDESPDKDKDSSAAATSKPDPSASTYTMCSPQLLHLDTDGTPLWFNGWLLVNKYVDHSKRRFAPMTAYMREPQNKAIDDEFWKLTTDNMCCLTAEPSYKSDLTEHDLGLLKMMRHRATEVGIME
ncbi:glycosyltransferase family 71 protein [Nemania sp. NC0429]|nr:glycosyltransferase family 71 protein [Nemania sp. NC0429]